MDRLEVSPRSVRGYGNIIIPKLSTDFVGKYNEIYTDEDGYFVLAYGGVMLKASATVSNTIKGIQASLTVLVSTRDSDTPVSGLSVDCSVDDVSLTGQTTDSTGKCTFTWTPSELGDSSLVISISPQDDYAGLSLDKTVTVGLLLGFDGIMTDLSLEDDELYSGTFEVQVEDRSQLTEFVKDVWVASGGEPIVDEYGIIHLCEPGDLVVESEGLEQLPEYSNVLFEEDVDLLTGAVYDMSISEDYEIVLDCLERSDIVPTGPTVNVVLTSSGSSVSVGDSVIFTATCMLGDEPIVGETVSFYDGNTLLGSDETDSNGVATYTASSLNAGVHTVSAVCEDKNSNNVSVTVNKLTPSISLTVPATGTVDSAYSITGTLVPSSGSVKLYENNVLKDTLTVTSGSFSKSITQNAEGTYSYYVVFEGSSTYDSITSSTSAIVVSDVPPVIEYQEVEYIGTTGTQYIDTGFKPNNNTRTYIRFYAGTLGTNVRAIFGSRDATTYNDSYTSFYLGSNTTSAGRMRVDYYNANSNNVYLFPNTSDETEYELDYNKNIVTLNGATHTFTPQTFNSNNNIFLFTCNNGGIADNRMMIGKIYACKIWDNEVLIRNLIPCYRKSDNVIGLYDIVNDVFYTNAGTGTFSKGPDVTPAEYDGVSLTVDENILSYEDGDTCTLTAQLTDSGSPVSRSGVTVEFFKGSTSLGTADTNSSGVATKSYASAGSGDVSFTAEADSIISSEIYVEDCIDYQPLTSNAHQSRWTIPSAVSSSSIFGYSENGWKFGNASSYSTISSTNNQTVPYSMEFTLTDKYNTSSNASPIFGAYLGTKYIMCNIKASTVEINLNGSSSSYSKTVSTPAVIRYELTSNSVSVYIDDVLVGTKSHSITGTPVPTFQTGSNRWNVIKDYKIKPL